MSHGPTGTPLPLADPSLRITECSREASGPTDASEIPVNWAVGQKLKALLEEAGYRVVPTKLVEEELVTNRHRAEIGTLHDADVMVRHRTQPRGHRRE